MKLSTLTLICLLTAAAGTFSGCASQEKIMPKTVHFTPSRSGEMKVMTFNIRTDTFLDGWNGWKQRKQMVADTITDNAADIFGLQEAKFHQLEDIENALVQYDHYYACRNDGSQKGESCPIFYRKDRFVQTDSGTFWFSGTPAKPGSKGWGNLWPRICSWVHLIDQSTNHGLYVYNVHMDNLSQHSREKSVRLLADRIAGRKTPDPFIVMGDFNMTADNPAMRYLKKIGHDTPYPRMVDAWSLANLDKTDNGTRHGFGGGTSGPKIDHIPLGDGIMPLAVNIDRRSYNGRYPSDHFPVIATIVFKNAEQISSVAPKKTENIL